MGEARDGAATMGQLLRGYRERALLTQERLAEVAGLSVRTVRGLELGQVRRPRMGSIRDLAAALELDDDEREALVLAVRATEPPAVRRPAQHPSQLPMDVADFTGRAAHVQTLLNQFGDEAPPGAMVICALAGRGGVGKTAMAVHVAHQLRALP
jgi:transcriptional regulator with XRE-family HTH domain